MTIGKQKCKLCKKLYRCKLQSSPHVHAEINGVKIIATIHEDNALQKFLSKLDSYPYEPSLKSLKGECDGELCRERSYYDIRNGTNRTPTRSTHGKKTPISPSSKKLTPLGSKEKKPAEIEPKKDTKQKNESLQSLPIKGKQKNKNHLFRLKKKKSLFPKKYQSEGEDLGIKKHEVVKGRRKSRKESLSLTPPKSRSKQ